jgi:hypothetical protein
VEGELTSLKPIEFGTGLRTGVKHAYEVLKVSFS